MSVTWEEPLQSVVEMRGITKTFGSTRALRGVDLTLKGGEVHALLGRNGAGKSTLVSALSGLTPSDSGSIRSGDLEIQTDGRDYASTMRSLVAHVHQEPQMFGLLTVAENLFIANESMENKLGFVSHKRMAKQASQLINSWGMDIDPNAQVGELSAETRQLLEILKALTRGVPIIILDEPTAALSNAEKKVLYRSVLELKSQGVSFIYISHHLEEVFEIADVVTILRDGEVVTDREPVAHLDAATIAHRMMGKEVIRSSRSDFTRIGQPPILSAVDVVAAPGVEAITLDVVPGEILALAGPVGGGKEELAMVIAGQSRAVSGTITSPGGSLPIIGFVPTDRHESGYIRILSIRENVAAGGLETLSTSSGFIRRGEETDRIDRLCHDTDVLASSWEQPVGELSGGNQQKVVFARALCRSPQVIVAMSPTRGVDVGAKEQLYKLLRELAEQGLGVVVVSDEHEEIDQLANRVVILAEGRLIDTLSGDYALQDLILRMEGVA